MAGGVIKSGFAGTRLLGGMSADMVYYIEPAAAVHIQYHLRNTVDDQRIRPGLSGMSDQLEAMASSKRLGMVMIKWAGLDGCLAEYHSAWMAQAITRSVKQAQDHAKACQEEEVTGTT